MARREGCHGAGRSLAQRLVADGEPVVDVPAKLAARIRVFSKGHGRKTDADDAASIALAALRGDGVFPVQVDGTMASLRLLADRREELVALRTQAACRLHRLLAELTPGGMSRGLSAGKVEALLPKLRPQDAAGRTRLQLAEQHLEDIRTLDGKLKNVRTQIMTLVESTGTHLPDLYGVGPVIAGRIIAEVEDIGRFPSKDHFASYNGTAPIDASSGERVRHRLSRAGNRRINHALHIPPARWHRNPRRQRKAPPRLSRRSRAPRIIADSMNLLPAAAEMRRPQPRSRLAAGHPQGNGLDRGEDGATLYRREQTITTTLLTERSRSVSVFPAARRSSACWV